MVGSVGNLYASVQQLDAAYVLPGAAKDALLCPAVSSSPANNSLLCLPDLPSSVQSSKAFYRCSYGGTSNCRVFFTETYGRVCLSCGYAMTATSMCLPSTADSGQAVAQGGNANGGFVQGVVTYTVTDDLTVTPISPISSIILLKNFAVTDLSALQDKIVQIGYAEGVEILRASLHSRTVLTDVFLGKKDPNDA
ncbi:hypothetical protein QOZ80_1AG0010060 [Eleusine coracana subsp. coracana]|nr:hypothetical protein QOZ80_1AG0010060 [Eleusine coracana subsp. coracana]